MNCLIRIMKSGPLLAAALAAVLFAGCETVPTGPQETERPYSTEFQIGDKLTIQFTEPGIPSPWEQLISESGEILLPFNQSIEAAGKTKSQLEREIRDIYVPKLYNRMTVNVKQDDRWYWVRGEVRNPSQLKYISSMTVLKAIASAGDFNDFADRGDITIIRGTSGERLKVNAKNRESDLPIYPGDVIIVGRRL